MKKIYLVVVLIVISVSVIAFLYFNPNQNSYSVSADEEGKTTNKGLPFNIMSLSVTGDCTDFVKHNTGENYYPDEDYSGSAHAYAKIELSDMYGDECSDGPYKDFAKVRVSCDGYSRESDGPLYLYRLGQDADWDDAKEEITCTKYGCAGEDQEFSSGTHTVNLRDEHGEVDSAFFVCYDYDSNSGYWTWAWTGWGFWGDRKVCESQDEQKCSNNDVYWYDSCNNRGDKVDECGSGSCESWSKNYCSDQSTVSHSRTCYDRGCSQASCYEKRREETEVVKNCPSDEVCESGQCVETGEPEVSIIDKLIDVFFS